MTAQPLARRLQPCGPILDALAAERAREPAAEAAAAGGWTELLDAAWPALAPVFAASPYLAALARRSPERLRATLAADPGGRLESIIAATLDLAREPPPIEEAGPQLRRLKADLHLLTALCDLGGAWDLDAVTGALTRFADAAAAAALACVGRIERERGRLALPPSTEHGPIPGLFGLAMGKAGAFELNYSSDLDISLFWEPETLRLADGVDPQSFVDRCARTLTTILSERTAEGYVLRLDLRLRPDPSATPPVVAAPAAMSYYQSVGQNWERAAFIKARAAIGDLPAARAFLAELQPFVWRRSLDYAAISDIHSIKRQIHVHHVDERLTAAGADVKLGAGGIREIEFFAQTQQLILGGRDPSLRSSRSVDALDALAAAGHVSPEAAQELKAAYVRLRRWEHRIQMVQDEQTHTLPEDPAARLGVACLSGAASLGAFDAEVGGTLMAVNRRYGELFAEAESLSTNFGSLVFTGVEDDPETLRTLKRMGFSNPHQVSAAIRAWHHGRIPATRTERGRELFTRLAPRLLEAMSASGAPDAAFARFGGFFEGLSAGVQVQSLFLAQPALLALVVEVLASAPRLAAILSRRPDALDALLDPGFFAPAEEADFAPQIAVAARQAAGFEAGDFEAAMDAVRRIHREQMFRLGMQILSGGLKDEAAGRAFTGLAEACVQALAPAALAEIQRLGGAFPGEVAVVGMGKLGSREMTAGSDLDLMTVYRAEPGAMSEAKGWAAETVFGRFTQRLVAALTAPTAQGGLYEIDLRLRPSGAKGPAAVSLNAMADYYRVEAAVWEIMALTRARVVWASSREFGEAVSAAIETALRRPRARREVFVEARDMRALMERERPARSFWDLKLSIGAQVDSEFAAQALQAAVAGEGGPLRTGTLDALAALEAFGAAPAALIEPLARSWRLHQAMAQLCKAALGNGADAFDHEPEPFRRRLARAAGVDRFEDAPRLITRTRAEARAAFQVLLTTDSRGRRR
jgi:glutamate-ammonia-ligase adenylyltransferase